MDANIFHAGGVGAGQTAKICNHILLGILMECTSEAIALCVANGLDPKVLSERDCREGQHPAGRNGAGNLRGAQRLGA